MLLGPHVLADLNLSWNPLRDAGGVALATTLGGVLPEGPPKSNSLQRLGLAWTGQGPVAGVAWAQTIGATGNVNLSWLDLSNNRFDHTVGTALVQSIGENKSLTHLNLFGNPFASAIHQVAAALAANAALQTFVVSVPETVPVVEDRNKPKPAQGKYDAIPDFIQVIPGSNGKLAAAKQKIIDAQIAEEKTKAAAAAAELMRREECFMRGEDPDAINPATGLRYCDPPPPPPPPAGMFHTPTTCANGCTPSPSPSLNPSLLSFLSAGCLIQAPCV
jgi:hypothetical protein